MAVQTLSRLNRTCPSKQDTFVLDFANDRETILASFQPYYELATVAEDTGPNLLYDLKVEELHIMLIVLGILLLINKHH